MKKLTFLLGFIMFSFTACSDDGDIGPQGPQGPAGPAGEPGLIGTVFDLPPVDFTEADDYSLLLEYSDYTDVEVFESDVVLVYLRVGQDGEAGGEPVYLWRLLPQMYYLDGGATMQYNYDYTFFDVNIFLETDVAFSSLGDAFTDDQVFRIAIIPADFAQTTGVDISNYEAVMSAMKVQEENIPQLELQ